MALTPAEKQRRYRLRLKEKNGHALPLPPDRCSRDLIRAFDAAGPAEQRALARHILETLLSQVKPPPAAPEAAHEPDKRQIDIEEAIAAAMFEEQKPQIAAPAQQQPDTVTKITPALPTAKPEDKKAAGIWRGSMPIIVRQEAEQQNISAARLAELWDQAKAEKNWVAGKSTLSNVTKSWRRWLRASVTAGNE